MCVFYVFGGHRPAKTSIIIGVWGRGRQGRRGEVYVFFRGTENGSWEGLKRAFWATFLEAQGGGAQRVKIEPLRHQSRRGGFPAFFPGWSFGPGFSLCWVATFRLLSPRPCWLAFPNFLFDF